MSPYEDAPGLHIFESDNDVNDFVVLYVLPGTRAKAGLLPKRLLQGTQQGMLAWAPRRSTALQQSALVSLAGRGFAIRRIYRDLPKIYLL